MLNRVKLIKEINTVSQSLFVSHDDECTLAHQVWQQICADPLFEHKVQCANVPWSVPTWHDALSAVHPVAKAPSSYTVIAVDGSQIYPDRHQGTSCFLINIGSVILQYGLVSNATLDSNPHVFTNYESQDNLGSTDAVNCLRQQYELQAGCTLACVHVQNDTPLLLLFDGSLIFWHLHGQDNQLKQQFLTTYISWLQRLEQHNIMCAWYISSPKSRELVNLIRCALCNFDAEHHDGHTKIDHVVDATVAHFYLQPYQRSTLFKSTVSLCDEYPPSLQPHFFYMHNGDEIARVEIPYWIAQDAARVDAIAALMQDQCVKGKGYPIVLAESHEQAVVKGADRDFFYHLITQQSIEQKQRIYLSQKNVKKRGLGI